MQAFTFAAPGRAELSGNHTDHQRGCVLVAAVDREMTAQVSNNGTCEFRIFLDGFEPFSVDLEDLRVHPEERNTLRAIVRGLLRGFYDLGARMEGLDVHIQSQIFPGSGLGSLAAFEVLLGTILMNFFLVGDLDELTLARMCQWVESTYFGRSRGLMDQAAVALGGLAYMDFQDPENPVVEQIPVDFETYGYALCIISTGENHEDLTGEHAAIADEMRAVANCLGCDFLREVPEWKLFRQMPALRKAVGDRAVLRAMHFFYEQKRVEKQVKALKKGDFEKFLELVNESGDSSWELLQNITPRGAVGRQELALALAMARRTLKGKGAVRVHGGGFAGSIQAFAPVSMVDGLRSTMEKLFGEGCMQTVNVRPYGAARTQ